MHFATIIVVIYKNVNRKPLMIKAVVGPGWLVAGLVGWGPGGKP